ncbi:putative DNA mismatch repair protein [Bacteroides graminisolvens DSM 19988 = JCM 15093]|uniref:Putative DNA mismatch repair protein n=1 Tax=Bacteroides graminisolvens DSM 19988 = JCM 15093 TaxID=1121097 RepID=A0A069D2Z3_9BACE|nr:putative DNA mismatch repair protein [Bacteroides graminisolvens DSM 19988 = JCM 15093]
MKIGDRVRFLNEVGGGIVTGFKGKDIVLVEDADGFDFPMLIRECVVIETDDYNIKRKSSSGPVSVQPEKKINKPEITLRPVELSGGIN